MEGGKKVESQEQQDRKKWKLRGSKRVKSKTKQSERGCQ